MPSAYRKTNGDYSCVELDWRNDLTPSEISGAVNDLLFRLDCRAEISTIMSSIIKTLKSAEPTDLPSRMWLSDLYYTHKAWTTWTNKSSAHGRMYLFRLVAVCKAAVQKIDFLRLHS